MSEMETVMRYPRLMFLLLLASIFDDGVTAAEQFLISRVPRQKGDRFQIANSACQSITSVPKCAEYSAVESGSDCKCQCPSTMASLLYNGSKWRCSDDKTIRQEEKCAALVGTESRFSQLPVLEPGLSRSWALKTLYGKNESCGINLGSSKYLDCSGSWHPLYSINKLATIEIRDAGIFLKIIPDKIQPYMGRIIRLDFTSGCSVTGNGVACLLLKLKGNMTCPMKKIIKPTETPQGISKQSKETTFKETITQIQGRNVTVNSAKSSKNPGNHYILMVSLVASAVVSFGVAISSLLVYRLYRSRRKKCVLYRRSETRHSKTKEFEHNNDRAPLPNTEASEKRNSENAEFGRQLSYLNLGFVLEDSMQHGTNDSSYFSSQTYYDALKGDVISFSNPIALDSPDGRINRSAHLEDSNVFSNTENEICAEAISDLTEQGVDSQIEVSQSLSSSEKSENNIDNNLLKPPTEMNNARKSLSRSLESIDSGYDNVTLCEDLNDTQGQYGVKIQEDKNKNSFEEEEKCKDEETPNNTSVDSNVRKRSPSGSLLEDILQDLRDREIIGDDPLFNANNECNKIEK